MDVVGPPASLQGCFEAGPPAPACLRATLRAIVKEPWAEVKDDSGQTYWWNKTPGGLAKLVR